MNSFKGFSTLTRDRISKDNIRAAQHRRSFLSHIAAGLMLEPPVFVLGTNYFCIFYDVLAENVRGLKDRETNFYLGSAFSLLLQHGYHLLYVHLMASQFGVPQPRERVFLFGTRPDVPFCGECQLGRLDSVPCSHLGINIPKWIDRRKTSERPKCRDFIDDLWRIPPVVHGEVVKCTWWLWLSWA